VRCGERIAPGERWDLGHVDGSGLTEYAGPEHERCNRATAGRARPVLVPALPKPEHPGLAASDGCWDVPWLKPLRRVPRDSGWPRLMSVPHKDAAGSLGARFIRWSEQRSNGRLRWWQRLAATRILETDAAGKLCWDQVLLSMPRQLGKSWLLRELCLWRLLQGARFGEQQMIIHTGNNLAVCMEVQRAARAWAKQHPEFRVFEANGKEKIEYAEDGSRWMVFAKGSSYGFAASLVVVDEAWDVQLKHLEEGLEPTQTEREQPQLLLVSTAHRTATSLMLSRRRTALAELEAGEGTLMLEWSAPRGAQIDSPKTWRAASAHWSERRERIIGRQLASAFENTLEDPTEPDPISSFRSQWLNEWPQTLAEPLGGTEELLPPGLWADRTARVVSHGPIWAAIEDDYGFGAAVATVARLDDGRWEVDGWLCYDWDTAVADVLRLERPVRELLVGGSLMDRVPQEMTPRPRPAGSTNTRIGLALLRDLAAGAQVVHDDCTADIDAALTACRVRTTTAGLVIAASPHSHLVRALVWALGSAHRSAPEPAIY
jgi:hypothetical protein